MRGRGREADRGSRADRSAKVFAVGGAVQSFLGILGGPLADGLSSLAGMGDDFIGQNSERSSSTTDGRRNG